MYQLISVRDNIKKAANWTVNMLLDCERRNFLVQGYHKDVLAQKEAQKLAAIRRSSVVRPLPPPSPASIHSITPPSWRSPPRRGRGRRRNRKVGAGITDKDPNSG